MTPAPACPRPVVTLLLAPDLLGPAERYAAIARCGGAIVDTGMHFDKRRKCFHRFSIADTRGLLDLTIPVAKPQSYTGATYADILISDHSPWWHTLMTTLESAYGRTPYFEYYADDFRALLTPGRVATPMVHLCRDLDTLVCRLLAIPAPIYLSHPFQESQSPVIDLRRTSNEAISKAYPILTPYWQLRADTLGFIPGLSILDILFNLGPEALLRLLPK